MIENRDDIIDKIAQLHLSRLSQEDKEIIAYEKSYDFFASCNDMKLIDIVGTYFPEVIDKIELCDLGIKTTTGDQSE